MKIHYKPLSRVFPATHPRKGQQTLFVEKILLSMGIKVMIGDNNMSISLENLEPKHHTIRAGNKVKVGDFVQFYCWGTDINPKSGRSGPYHSKQIKPFPPIEVKKVWDFEIIHGSILVNNVAIGMNNLLPIIAENDGLAYEDFKSWFGDFKKPFSGQIISWNDKIDY